MCQLFALSSNTPTAVTFSFTGFSARGGATGEHADGWGIAFHDDRDCRVFIDDRPACRSPLAEFLRRQPMPATAVLAHVRKATQGAVQLANCHPFQRSWRGRSWTFCHNGDLKGFAPELAPAQQPVGTTDSEAAFCWLLAEIERRFDGPQPPHWPLLAPVLHELVTSLARYGPINMLLSDGRAIYAHCSTRLHWLQRRHPFAAARLVDADLALDLGQVNSRDDRMVLLATKPLTHDEPWQALDAGELLVLSGGERVWGSAEAARCIAA